MLTREQAERLAAQLRQIADLVDAETPETVELSWSSKEPTRVPDYERGCWNLEPRPGLESVTLAIRWRP